MREQNEGSMRSTEADPEPGVVTVPAPPPDAEELPTALTFFLSVEERRRVLRKLKRLGKNRSASLLCALKIDPSLPLGALKTSQPPQAAVERGRRHG